MKKKTISAFLVMLFFGCLSPVLAAETDAGDAWSSLQEAGEGEIRVLYVPAEGWAYEDAEGQLTGVTVELMRWFADWVAAEHDVELSVDFVREEDWSLFYERIRDAEAGVFGVGNVTITSERKEELAFSPPYVNNVAVGITHEDIPELGSVEELGEGFEGLTALAFRGTLHEERLRELRDAHAPDLEIAHAESNDEILERVAEGGYFAYIDAYNYWPAREAGKPLRHHPVLDDPGEQFGVILPRDTEWEAVMEEFFEADGGLQSRRDYRELLEKHLGAEVAELLLDHP